MTGRPGSATAVFVFGEMRSGTNMLVDVFSRSRFAECYEEYDDEAYHDYVLRDDRTIEQLIARSCARRVVFKPITSNQKAAQLLDRFPDSRGVWIYRRYLDVVNSAVRNFSENNKYLYYMLHDPETAGWRLENVTEENLELVRRIWSAGASEESARALIWYLRNCQLFQQALDCDDRLLVVRYEDIVRSPDVHVRRVFDFVGLEFEPAVTRGLFQSSIDKHASPDIDPEIEELCRGLLARLDNCSGQGPAD